MSPSPRRVLWAARRPRGGPRPGLPGRGACELSAPRVLADLVPGASRSGAEPPRGRWEGGREGAEGRADLGWSSRPPGFSLSSWGGGSQPLGKLLHSWPTSSSGNHFQIFPTFRLLLPSPERRILPWRVHLHLVSRGLLSLWGLGFLVDWFAFAVQRPHLVGPGCSSSPHLTCI